MTFNIGWRQTRIFTSDFSDQWYFGLLTTFAIPFSQKYPETPFWFTRYTGNRQDPKDDVCDTDITKLAAPYLNANQDHRSLRFRFCPVSDEEAFLESLFTNKCWRFDFRTYDVLGEFGGSRFCSSSDIDHRLRRTELVAQLFYTNCLFVLNAMKDDKSFEENSDSQNAFNKSTFLSTLHIFNNVYGNLDGKGFHLYLLDRKLEPNTPFNWCRL